MTEPLAPGDKVEVIKNWDNAWRKKHGYRDEITPVTGIVYTVRSIDIENGIRLVEVVNKPRKYRDGFDECTFDIINFRPIRRRETSITIFQDIAREVKQGAPREIVDA